MAVPRRARLPSVDITDRGGSDAQDHRVDRPCARSSARNDPRSTAGDGCGGTDEVDRSADGISVFDVSGSPQCSSVSASGRRRVRAVAAPGGARRLALIARRRRVTGRSSATVGRTSRTERDDVDPRVGDVAARARSITVPARTLPTPIVVGDSVLVASLGSGSGLDSTRATAYSASLGVQRGTTVVLAATAVEVGDLAASGSTVFVGAANADGSSRVAAVSVADGSVVGRPTWPIRARRARPISSTPSCTTRHR